jgi:cell division transport system permease protein
MFNTISLFRVIRSGAVNFWRNRWLSAASTLIMVITLIILSILSLLFVITQSSVRTIRERVDISAYFKTGLAENQILSVKSRLEQNPKVRSVTYVSAEQALEEFKALHRNDPLITDSIKELNENPLPATLQVKAVTLDDYPAISEELTSDQYKAQIDKVNFEDNRVIIDRLNRLLKFIIAVGLALVIIFSLIAILVIFNTITLTIYNRREEVEIMRLVGATNWYIRGPFLTEALMYSVVGTVITSALLAPIYLRLLPGISHYLNPSTDIFAASYFRFYYLILIQLIVACALSIISSTLAIRRYLKI